ncbi:hypothetical protein [Streptomyces sp. 8N616]|uniref:hypothetical protein n=1 Tax=Streptomyces sp. 8N616 TaxID=3457414 RepID=UPI003FD09991
MVKATTGHGSSLTADGFRQAVPGAELLAVIGPAGPARTALLTALARRPWLRGGGTHRPRARIAVVRDHGPGAPDPHARVEDLLAAARGVHRPGSHGQEPPQEDGRRDAVGGALAAAGLALAEGAGRGRAPGVLQRRVRYEVLSRADQLLFALALALADEPASVLVDAADDGLDATARHRVWSRLRRIAESGTTVVAACDSAEAAGIHAHRTVLLPSGSGAGGAVGAAQHVRG